MNYKVIRETLHDSFDKIVGKSVLLLQWSTRNDDVDLCIDDTTIYYTEESETSYGIAEWEEIFSNRNFAEASFLNESQLIKNG